VDIADGTIAFNAGCSYKNALASALANMGFVGGKFLKMALNARRVLLLGIERGITFVADKVAFVGDQVDWLIAQVSYDACGAAEPPSHEILAFSSQALGTRFGYLPTAAY
jgi:hypothetical protein